MNFCDDVPGIFYPYQRKPERFFLQCRLEKECEKGTAVLVSWVEESLAQAGKEVWIDKAENVWTIVTVGDIRVSDTTLNSLSSDHKWHRSNKTFPHRKRP